jgi:hypothetical protein
MTNSAMETDNIPMTQESLHVETTNEDNAYNFLISRVLFTLNSFHHKAKQSNKPIMLKY